MLTAHRIFNEVYEEDYQDFYKDGGYSYAVRACEMEGGKLVYNSNDGNSAVSFAPTLKFEFSDGSILRVDYSGVQIELEEERTKRIRRRIEDYLRKNKKVWKLLEIATDLGVSLD